MSDFEESARKGVDALNEYQPNRGDGPPPIDARTEYRNEWTYLELQQVRAILNDYSKALSLHEEVHIHISLKPVSRKYDVWVSTTDVGGPRKERRHC